MPVRGTFSASRAWRPTVGAGLTRTLARRIQNNKGMSSDGGKARSLLLVFRGILGIQRCIWLWRSTSKRRRQTGNAKSSERLMAVELSNFARPLAYKRIEPTPGSRLWHYAVGAVAGAPDARR